MGARLGRPWGVRGAAGVLVASAAGGVVLGAVAASGALALGWGMEWAMVLSSVLTFGVPGVVARRYVVGRWRRQGVRVTVLLLSLLLVFACQGVVAWASAVDVWVYTKIWGDCDPRLVANAEALLSVCHFDGAWGWAVTIVVVAFVPAVVEEIFFRGALLPMIRRVTGGWMSAVVLSAVVFSLIHCDMSAFLSRMILGLVLGAIFVYSRTLLASISFHFLNNLLVVLTVGMAKDSMGILTARAEMPSLAGSLFSLAATVYMVYLVGCFSGTIRRSGEAGSGS